VYFCTLCPSVGPKERSRQALDRLPLVSNFLTNFWIQHFDGARLSPNSVRNAVWSALNEPVCQYFRTRNPRSSTVYIDNSLGPLARDSPRIYPSKQERLPYITFNVGIFITDMKCLLCGKTWIFKESRLHFVLKMVIVIRHYVLYHHKCLSTDPISETV